MKAGCQPAQGIGKRFRLATDVSQISDQVGVAPSKNVEANEPDALRAGLLHGPGNTGPSISSHTSCRGACFDGVCQQLDQLALCEL